MAIPKTREQATEDGKLQQYAHLYDVADESRLREEADNANKSAINNETSARRAADTELRTALDTEVAARKAAFDSFNVIEPKNVGEPPANAGYFSLAVGEDAKTYKDRATALGPYTRALQEGNVATGYQSTAYGSRCVSIGFQSYASGTESVAVGAKSAAYRDYEFAVGHSGENGTRFVSYVTDPKLDQDAATKHYVDTSIAAIPTADVTKQYVDSKVSQAQLSCNNYADAREAVAISHAAAMFTTTATASSIGTVKASPSITAASDGTISVNPAIFSDGLTSADGQVSVDLGFVGEHLAGDALYYDSTDGLMLKVGDGLEIQNDTVSIDPDTMPLASTASRGMVKVGKGLTISDDGSLSVSGGSSYPSIVRPMVETTQGVSVTGTGLTGSFAFLFGAWIEIQYEQPYILVESTTGCITSQSAFAAGTSVTFTITGANGVLLRFYNADAISVQFGPEADGIFGDAVVSFPSNRASLVVTVPVIGDLASSKSINFRIR